MQQFPIYRDVPVNVIVQELGKPISQELNLTGYDPIGIANSCRRDENLRILFHFFRLINGYAAIIENHEPKDRNYARCCQFCRAAGVIAQQPDPLPTQPLTTLLANLWVPQPRWKSVNSLIATIRLQSDWKIFRVENFK